MSPNRSLLAAIDDIDTLLLHYYRNALNRGHVPQVSELYPTIEYDEQIVDNTCQQLVINPQQFDVMVGLSPSLY